MIMVRNNVFTEQFEDSDQKLVKKKKKKREIDFLQCETLKSLTRGPLPLAGGKQPKVRSLITRTSVSRGRRRSEVRSFDLHLRHHPAHLACCSVSPPSPPLPALPALLPCVHQRLLCVSRIVCVPKSLASYTSALPFS